MNRNQFLVAYRAALAERYEWAQRDGKSLDTFIASVTATLNGASTWNHDGDAVTDAWCAIGGKGSPTLKALRALPLFDEVPTHFPSGEPITDAGDLDDAQSMMTPPVERDDVLIVESHATDNSVIYNVSVLDTHGVGVLIGCVDQAHAEEVAAALQRAAWIQVDGPQD